MKFILCSMFLTFPLFAFSESADEERFRSKVEERGNYVNNVQEFKTYHHKLMLNLEKLTLGVAPACAQKKKDYIDKLINNGLGFRGKKSNEFIFNKRDFDRQADKENDALLLLNSVYETADSKNPNPRGCKSLYSWTSNANRYCSEWLGNKNETPDQPSFSDMVDDIVKYEKYETYEQPTESSVKRLHETYTKEMYKWNFCNSYEKRVRDSKTYGSKVKDRLPSSYQSKYTMLTNHFSIQSKNNLVGVESGFINDFKVKIDDNALKSEMSKNVLCKSSYDKEKLLLAKKTWEIDKRNSSVIDDFSLKISEAGLDKDLKELEKTCLAKSAYVEWIEETLKHIDADTIRSPFCNHVVEKYRKDENLKLFRYAIRNPSYAYRNVPSHPLRNKDIDYRYEISPYTAGTKAPSVSSGEIDYNEKEDHMLDRIDRSNAYMYAVNDERFMELSYACSYHRFMANHPSASSFDGTSICGDFYDMGYMDFFGGALPQKGACSSFNSSRTNGDVVSDQTKVKASRFPSGSKTQ